MANNYLEELVAEWYEFKGYFVRRSIRVGRRDAGGHAGEARKRDSASAGVYGFRIQVEALQVFSITNVKLSIRQRRMTPCFSAHLHASQLRVFLRIRREEKQLPVVG